MSGTNALTVRPILPGVIAGTLTIDPAHTAVGFSVRHLMSKVRGTFSGVDGQIRITEDLAGSWVTAEIDLATVDTGNEMRDNHLRSGDFLDVDGNSIMRFASTGLRRADHYWTITGELTIRGVTRVVELELEYLGVDPTGMQGETRIGFEARGSIRRQDFGISFGLAGDGGKVIIGDKVDITLDVEAVLDAE